MDMNNMEACRTYLRYHHMAIKCAFTASSLGSVDV